MMNWGGLNLCEHCLTDCAITYHFVTAEGKYQQLCWCCKLKAELEKWAYERRMKWEKSKKNTE